MKPLAAAVAALATTLSLSAGAVGRLADLALYDRATGRELPVHWHEGKAYVVGRPGNEYQVIVRNRSGEDLLSVVSVDGVNAVSGETANPRQAGYVLSPWQEARISGWRKSLAETAAFYFTSLPDSYAARTGRPDNVGVIGVALYQRKVAPPPPPPTVFPDEAAPWDRKDLSRNERPMAEAPAAAAGSASRESSTMKRAQPSSPLGTGHGRRESSPTHTVEFERRTREPVETIAIYYDSYRNLAARGVLQAPTALREPDPFPTRFVPDPR
jgi:hypothetical protein